MTFTRPEGLVLLALAAPLVLLHMRWRKRRSVAVPSLALWTDLGGAGTARRGFRRVEDALQLALLLVALGAFAAGFAGPVTGDAAPPAHRLAIVIDGSASTSALADGAEDRRRFDVLRSAATDALSRLAPADEVVVWIASDRPRIAVDPTADKARAAQDLAAAEPTLDAADVAGTVRLARKALRGGGALLVLADAANVAGIDALAAEPGPRIATGVVRGRDERHAGITGIEIGRDEFTVRVHGDVTGRRVVVSRADRGPHPEFVPLVEGPPTDAPGNVFRVPRFGVGPGGYVRAELVPRDGFAQDDVCDVRVAGRPKARVAVLSADGRVSPFLVTSLRALTEHVDLDRTVLAGADAPPSKWAEADLVIALGDVPDAVPSDRPVMQFGAAGTRIAAQPRLWAAGAHPVTDGVVTDPLRLAEAAVLEPLPAETVLLECAEGPVAVCGERAGRRTVRFGFRADETTLAMEAAFPLLVRNAIEWLGRPPLLPSQVLAGGPIPLLESLPQGTDRLWIEGPGALPRRPVAVLGPRWLDAAPLPAPFGVAERGREPCPRIRITGLPGDHETTLRWFAPAGFELTPSAAAEPLPAAADAAVSLPDRATLRDTRRDWTRECALVAAAALALGALLLVPGRSRRLVSGRPPATS